MRLFKYPAVRKSGHSDVIFGKNVADPYRWLEDPDSAETKKFVKEQNSVVQDYLGQSDIRNKVIFICETSFLTYTENYLRI